MTTAANFQVPASESPSVHVAAQQDAPSCCSTEKQASCCDQSAKSSCCGAEATAESGCGCQ
jgi:hypothetical protein